MEKGFDSWILVCVVFRFDCWSGSEVVCVAQIWEAVLVCFGACFLELRV